MCPHGARGPWVAPTRLAGTGFGLSVAARAFACGLIWSLLSDCPGMSTGEAVAEARPEPPATALPAQRTPPRPSCLGGELSASARHLAAFHRLPAYRRITPASATAAVVCAGCLHACVRCRARVCCAARPLTSGCIVTCVWSHVCDERVRGGARAPPRMRLIRYLLIVGKVSDLPGHHLYISADRGRPRSDSAQPVISSVAPDRQ